MSRTESDLKLNCCLRSAAEVDLTSDIDSASIRQPIKLLSHVSGSENPEKERGEVMKETDPVLQSAAGTTHLTVQGKKTPRIKVGKSSAAVDFFF